MLFVCAPRDARPSADCTFANLGGDGFDTKACDVCSAAVLSNNATVAVVNSTFLDPLPRNGSTYVRAWAGGAVLLSGCSFAPTPGLDFSPFYAYDNATIYSADAEIRVRTDARGTLAAPTPPAAIPAAARGSKAVLLRRDDPWFRSTRIVRHPYVQHVSPGCVHLLPCTSAMLRPTWQ